MSAKELVKTPIQLYKYLLRTIERLPTEEIRIYYKDWTRNNYRSHSDESDPERVQEIIQRALDNADWVLKKYTEPKK